MGLPGGFARNFNMWGGVGCVNVGVHVYTWYAAGVFMCTHGTLLVCHVQKCYAWGGVGWGVLTFVFICKHGTLLLCHVQTYHAIAVSRLIVHRFLILIGFNVFLLAMCLKNSAVSLALGTRSGVQGLGECMSSSEATATESSHSALYACSISSICWAIVESSAHGRIRFIKVSRAATTCSGARGCLRWNLIHASFSTPKPVCNESVMLPNRMHHLEDKLTEPNPTNCLPHVAARTPASFKARTWINLIQEYVATWNVFKNSRWSTYPQWTLILPKNKIKWTHRSEDAHAYMIYISPEVPDS